SPPSGPPSGMNFSRRKLAQPLPPSPALTVIRTSSTNFMMDPGHRRRDQDNGSARQPAGTKAKALPRQGHAFRRRAPGSARDGVTRDDVDETTVLVAAHLELHLAVDQRKQG